MSLEARDLSSRIVRFWAAFYTLGLPKSVRERRLIEIDSDIWEQNSSARDGEHSAHLEVLGRMARGAWDDACWRISVDRMAMAMRISVGLAMLGLLAIDFLVFHDIMEHRAVTEYMTGVVSIPLLLVLAGLLTGVLRISWNGR